MNTQESIDLKQSVLKQQSILKPGFIVQTFSWLGLPIIFAVMVYFAMLPMTWQQQAVFGAVLTIAAFAASRISAGEGTTMLLVILSMGATMRYGYWRLIGVRNYITSPYSVVDKFNAVVMIVLLAAELYAFLILFLGFIQTIAPLRRMPLPLPPDSGTWPTVDVMIPTFNEPLDVVRYTVLAAMDIDWPSDKLNICLLDDGCRDEFREFARQAGVKYIVRAEHKGAKAGNINNALKQTFGEFVAVFDSDHIPTRSFLQVTMGWFLKDPKLGLMQTPHQFYSPDPFERNLNQFRKIPNEGELFYGVVQDANDLWNATFFCGSCAVLRRTALDQVKGIAEETVTEDAHTSLRIQIAGWNTAYLNIPQSAGLATESVAGHIRQRTRWARGMIQIMRVENPLFARNLKLLQRLCYFNAMLHFLYSVPRLIFLTAPLMYLIFGWQNVPGYWLAILVFAAPHLVLSTVTNSRIQGRKRHSFWNEIYETVLSPYILIPTILAMINPKLGSFNVTAKGNQQTRSTFDAKIATPFLVLLGLNVFGLLMSVPRYLYWDQIHLGTILMNAFWTLFNIIVLGVTLSVCWEERQLRKSVRIVSELPVRLHSGGIAITTTTKDLSNGGLAVLATGDWQFGQRVHVEFFTRGDDSMLPARVIETAQGTVRLQFLSSTLEEQRSLSRVLYSPANCWLDWDESRPADSPIRSLLSVFSASVLGFRKMARLLTRKGRREQRGTEASPVPAQPSLVPAQTSLFTARSVIAILIVGSLLLGYFFFFSRRAQGETVKSRSAAPSASAPSHQSILFGSVQSHPMLIRGAGSGEDIVFSLPSSILIEGASINLKYKFDQEFVRQQSYFEVLLNGAVVAAVTPSKVEQELGQAMQSIALPPDLLIRSNRLSVRLMSRVEAECQEKDTGKLWAMLDAGSTVELDSERLHLADNLNDMSALFGEHVGMQPARVSFVFSSFPESGALQAAGVLASWFGVQSDDAGIRFSTNVGTMPTGNAVLLLLRDQSVANIGADGQGASISIRDNPSDAFGKVLVVHGNTSADLLRVVQALTTQQLELAGPAQSLKEFHHPSQRQVDDAPRWVQGDRALLSQLTGSSDLKSSDASPMNVYLHLSPDINFGSANEAYLHLVYQTNDVTLGKGSNLTVRLNGASSDSVPIDSSVQSPTTTNFTNIHLAGLGTGSYGNTLQLQFYAVSPDAGSCTPLSAPFQGTISGASFIDLGGAAHFARLPNLKMFANSGYPFTRRADLSDTAVLMSPDAPLSTISLYLDMMGHFGRETGYPVLGVTVASIRSAADFPDKDLLVLGTYQDMARSSALADKMPFGYRDGRGKLSLRASLGLLPQRLEQMLTGDATPPFDEEAAASADGVIEGFESPYSSGRSTVLVLGRDEKLLDGLTAELMEAMPKDLVADSVTLWRNHEFRNYPLDVSDYYVGQASGFEAFNLWLPASPFTVVALLLVLCGLGALWLREWIGYRIRTRLAGAS